MAAYICEGTLVKTDDNRNGLVIGVDRKTGIAVIKSGKTSYTEKLKSLKVISYKGVN